MGRKDDDVMLAAQRLQLGIITRLQEAERRLARITAHHDERRKPDTLTCQTCEAREYVREALTLLHLDPCDQMPDPEQARAEARADRVLERWCRHFVVDVRDDGSHVNIVTRRALDHMRGRIAAVAVSMFQHDHPDGHPLP